MKAIADTSRQRLQKTELLIIFGPIVLYIIIFATKIKNCMLKKKKLNIFKNIFKKNIFLQICNEKKTSDSIR